MQLDRHFVFAGILDRALEHDFVAVDLQTELVLHPVHNVLRRDGTESFSGFAGRKRERQPRFPNLAGDFFRVVQFAPFAFGAFLLQIVELAQGRRRHFVGFAFGEQIITRVATAHLDHVGFSAEAGHVIG